MITDVRVVLLATAPPHPVRIHREVDVPAPDTRRRAHRARELERKPAARVPHEFERS
jgi:hypothetical protein